MKTFAYVVRDKNGALRRGVLQSADRVAAFERLRKDGGVPVSVTEGMTSGGRGLAWRTVNATISFATVCVIAVGVCVWLFARHKSNTVGIRKPSPEYAEIEPKPLGKTPAREPAATVGNVVAEENHEPESTLPIVPSSNSGHPVLPGHIPEHPVDDVRHIPPPPRTPFKSATEQVLSMVYNATPGVRLPPLPVLSGLDKDFVRASANTLEIHDSDDERLQKAVETVAWAKVDLADAVKQGWKPDEFIQELARRHNEEADLKADTARVLKKMLDDGTLARNALENELQMINEELAARGLPVITLAELGLDD